MVYADAPVWISPISNRNFVHFVTAMTRSGIIHDDFDFYNCFLVLSFYYITGYPRFFFIHLVIFLVLQKVLCKVENFFRRKISPPPYPNSQSRKRLD
mmetsp:Transcript_27045/g.56827  ORF Transcript_27045/g.56827 Transcript_27045/m.56827 type:complete len:97 (-) Transcript_27045:43-333(-)